MAWCPGSKDKARTLCSLLLGGTDPIEALERVLGDGEASATCIEDIGRSILAVERGEECARILAGVRPSPGLDDRVLAGLFMIPYTYYRRIRDVDRMKTLLQAYEHLVTPGSLLEAVFLHAKAMFVEKSEEFDLESRILDALSLELRVLEVDPSYLGARHKYADLVAQLLEEGYKPGPCRLPGNGCIPEGYVLRAMEYLRDIIRRYNYARAYYTYGRIRASLGDYKEAETLISQAIRVEDPSVRDYELRLAEYYNMLFLVKNMARMEERLRQLDRIIKERLGEVEERLRENVRLYEERVLAWTSIYIAVIAIIITYVFTATSPNLDFTHALTLLLLLYASIISSIYIIIRHIAGPRAPSTTRSQQDQ